MSNLLSDIFGSYVDFHKTKSKSRESGILKNKPTKTFSVFEEKTGKVDLDKLVQAFTSSSKSTNMFSTKSKDMKNISSILSTVWFVIIFGIVLVGKFSENL